jgi:hypothetical protein
MIINQIAIAIFGMSLTFAAVSAHGDNTSFDAFTLIVSIFSIIFYLFLIYNMAWEIGAKDKISVDVKKKTYRPYLGFVLSLIANIPNLILVAIYAATTFSGAEKANGIIGLISCFANGMYWGTMIVFEIQRYWVSFLVAVAPAIIASGIAYFLGHKNFKFFGFITNKKPAPSNERPNMK